MIRILLAAIFSAAFLLPAESHAVQERGGFPLSSEWMIQPATTPDQPPKPDDWGKTPSAEWRRGEVMAAGTTWAKVARGAVNSLWYEQEVSIPADWRGRRVVAKFPLIQGDAIVFLNGKRVGELLRPGGEIDLSAQVAWGEKNSLRVFVTRDYTGISRNFTQDPLRFTTRAKIPMADWPMGITEPVALESRPRAAAITDVFVIPSWRNKNLTLEVEVEADKASKGLTLEAVILDAEQKEVLTVTGKKFAAAAGRSTFRISKPWSDFISWEMDGSYLYQAKVRLRQGDRIVDAAPPVSFGFREVWTEGSKLMLNGHPSHWRLTWISNQPALSFFRLMGFNTSQFQANPTAWWNTWCEIPICDEELLKKMDATGTAATIPVPTINNLRSALLTDERARADYEKEMQSYLRRYRNHPSILAWVMGMNTYNPRDAIDPEGMGRRPTKTTSQAQLIENAIGIVKRFDPTRLVYSHADGNVGDISTANLYLNWVPLQEQMEWPKAWAKSGNMPFGAVEFGLPLTDDYWKGGRFLLTDYLAIYFGDEAYRSESESGLRQTKTNGSHAGFTIPGRSINLSRDFPKYWDLESLFVREVSRAWRTWGVNAGCMDWRFTDVAYGEPTIPYGGKMWLRYSSAALKEPLTKRPDWANANFDSAAAVMQPLLVYLGGAPQFTDKTHAYFEGETVSKQVVAIWDGPNPCKLQAHWQVTRPEDGETLAQGEADFDLKTGQIAFAPLSFAAPTVESRSEVELSLAVQQDGKIVGKDSFRLQVFPRPSPLTPSGRVIVYDPADKSHSWIKSLVRDSLSWTKEMKFLPGDLLVIGREALPLGATLPYTAADISRGLKVIMLEQRPETWEALGFQTIETMPRYLFQVDASDPVLSGLQPADLVNWRGSPDLLPEGKAARSYDFRHAPKWVNTHAAASVVMQIPQVAGFTPLLQAEFGLNYSPLLRWAYGQGEIFFSTLDLSGRVGIDPAATLLARNLLSSAMSPIPPTRMTYYAGDVKGREALKRLQIEAADLPKEPDPERSLIVLGAGELLTPHLEKIVEQGGHVVGLPRGAQELEKMGFKTATVNLARATPAEHPWLLSVGQKLLRWRVPLDVTAFAPEGQPEGWHVLSDGVFLERTLGKGKILFLQVGPEQLDALMKDPTNQAIGLAMSVQSLQQLQAQILTAAGATPTPMLAERLARQESGPAFSVLTDWRALGPYPDKANTPAAKSLAEPYDGEADAISGHTDISVQYRPATGQAIQWKLGVNANTDGFVNLGQALEKNAEMIAYATTVLPSDSDRVAQLRLGVDFWFKVWLNGQVIYQVADVHGSPQPNAFKTNVTLRKGENILTVKVKAGGGGCGFWANISNPETLSLTRKDNEKPTDLYPCKDPNWDPYQYFYW